MQIEHLTDEDTKALIDKIAKLQEINPTITYRVFEMKGDENVKEGFSIPERLEKIEGEVKELHRKIDLIFDGHVLICGRFQKMDLS